jgi:hypothetical protein
LYRVVIIEPSNFGFIIELPKSGIFALNKELVFDPLRAAFDLTECEPLDVTVVFLAETIALTLCEDKEFGRIADSEDVLFLSDVGHRPLLRVEDELVDGPGAVVDDENLPRVELLGRRPQRQGEPRAFPALLYQHEVVVEVFGVLHPNHHGVLLSQEHLLDAELLSHNICRQLCLIKSQLKLCFFLSLHISLLNN